MGVVSSCHVTVGKKSNKHVSQNVELFLLTDFSNVLRSSVRCEVFRLKVLRIKFWGMIIIHYQYH